MQIVSWCDADTAMDLGDEDKEPPSAQVCQVYSLCFYWYKIFLALLSLPAFLEPPSAQVPSLLALLVQELTKVQTLMRRGMQDTSEQGGRSTEGEERQGGVGGPQVLLSLLPPFTTPFTCFTSTTVQILTQGGVGGTQGYLL